MGIFPTWVFMASPPTIPEDEGFTNFQVLGVPGKIRFILLLVLGFVGYLVFHIGQWLLRC